MLSIFGNCFILTLRKKPNILENVGILKYTRLLNLSVLAVNYLVGNNIN